MDPITGAAVIGAGAQLYGGMTTARAQSRANSKNMWIYKDQRDRNEMHMKSQMQYRVNDLKLAGLNPMLAYMQGGSGMAAAGSGSIEAETGEGESVENAVATALQATRLKEEIKTLKAEQKVKNEAAKKTQAETKVLNKTMPKAEAVGKSGELISRGLETISSTARKFQEKRHIKQAESTAKKNYKRSQAYKDAQAAKRRKRK
jgi:hypothetical protein